MNNPVLFNSMLQKYTQHSVSHFYILGFTLDKIIYRVTISENLLPQILKLDKASRGNGFSLRFSPTKKQKQFLLIQGAQVVCSQKMFQELINNNPYNRGEIFEKLIVESAGLQWKKETAPFFRKPDIIINNINYQIKFERGTMTNEKTLLHLSNTP